VRAALDELPDGERAAVLLRDAYDLPPQAVAVALRRDDETTASIIAAGRLHLVSLYEGRPPPSLAGHTARTPADLSTLGQLADGTLAPQRSVGLRRHLGACVACEETVDALARARRLAAGLPVIAMPDEAREAMLERVTERATAVLPSVDEVLVAVEEDEQTRPAISPLVVVAAIVVALVLGVAVAAATRSGGSGADTTTGGILPSTQPTLSPAFPVISTSPSASATASHSARPSTTPSRTASGSPTATSSTVVVNPTLAVNPTSGPRGTPITVTGTGWGPGDTVAIRYSGAVTNGSTTVTADSHGRFVTTVTANGLVPGDYTLRATGSSGTATATFTQTS
jgi:hypothetical protein